MLLITLVGVTILRSISAEPPVGNTYLPPPPPFAGYPPSRPPQLGEPSVPAFEDPESIVIDVPPFGRNRGSLSSEITGSRINNEPLSTSVQQNLNGDKSFTHFHRTSNSFIDTSNRVYRPDQYYAKTTQHIPSVQTAFNNAHPYQGISGSTPYQHISQNTQSNLLNTVTSDAYLGGSINPYGTSHFSSLFKDQYHHSNIRVPYSEQNKYDFSISDSSPIDNFNNQVNQYIPPPTRAGYSYPQPNIPFNFEN